MFDLNEAYAEFYNGQRKKIFHCLRELRNA